MSGVLDKIAHVLHLDKSHPHHKAQEVKSETPAAAKRPAFDHNKVTVIFVLGGPGAGTRAEYRDATLHIILALTFTLSEQAKELNAPTLLRTSTSAISQVNHSVLILIISHFLNSIHLDG